MYSAAVGKTSKTEAGLIRIVDFRSDTLSLPNSEMRKAMAEAEVGDDVYGEDPTVRKFEERVATLFGKEAAIFVPTGTMANLISIMVHCNQRGSEAICGTMSHTFLYEQGGAAQLAGVQLSTIPNNVDGTFSLETLRKSVRGFDFHEPITKLVIVENTHNMCGGKVLPLEWLDQLVEVARAHSLKIHMDGARLFNAAEFMKVPVSRIVRDIDSVCFCLSKGLTAPVGSVLVGTTQFITEARRMRKVLGGGMRQVGILAAAGIVALDTIVPKIGNDHRHAREVAEAIHRLKSPMFTVDIDSVQTNILLIQLENTKVTAFEFAERLAKVEQRELDNGIVDACGKGISVKLSARDWAFVRVVSYSQITDEDNELAIKKIVFVIRELESI